MKLYYYDTVLGRIGLAGQNGRLTALYFAGETAPGDAEVCETSLLKEAAAQLHAYLAGSLQAFSLPLAPAGTDFMRRVWQALGEIPFGRTVSYKEIAVAIGKPQASRAVGQANNRNPLPIFIPCHRVIAATGTLAGYRGGIELKRRLLAIEGVQLCSELRVAGRTREGDDIADVLHAREVHEQPLKAEAKAGVRG